MAAVERLSASPFREAIGSRSKKLDMARTEGVKKLKEFIVHTLIPTLPGWQNPLLPEDLLSSNYASLAATQRTHIIDTMIKPVKKRLGLPAYEPVWHETVRNEMERWMREDLNLAPKKLKYGMRLVDKEMNKAVKRQKDSSAQRLKTLIQGRNKERKKSDSTKPSPVENDPPHNKPRSAAA